MVLLWLNDVICEDKEVNLGLVVATYSKQALEIDGENIQD